MRRFPLALAVALTLLASASVVASSANPASAPPASEKDEKKQKAPDREARARAEIRQVLTSYLDARFRGADWKDYRDFVTWTNPHEQQDENRTPACDAAATVVRSYDIADVRLTDKQTALATIVFYQLGEYCPATRVFKTAPHLDNAIFQMRKRSIVWAVEKTNRPGGQVDWNVVRDRLKQELAESFLVADARAQASRSLELLERTANAIGRTSPEARRPELQKAPGSAPTPEQSPEPTPTPDSPK